MSPTLLKTIHFYLLGSHHKANNPTKAPKTPSPTSLGSTPNLLAAAVDIVSTVVLELETPGATLIVRVASAANLLAGDDVEDAADEVVLEGCAELAARTEEQMAPDREMTSAVICQLWITKAGMQMKL